MPWIRLKGKTEDAVIVLRPWKVLTSSFVAGVTADVTSRIKAGELVGTIAAQVGGPRWWPPRFRGAGGSNPRLDAALAGVRELVRAGSMSPAGPHVL